MSTQSFDPVKYKTGQQQEWDGVAAGWRKWWETFEHGFQHLSDRMIELAEIRAGHHVLDIATGIGEPAITAAHQVGSAGRVLATDISPQMLEIARERAAALGLQNLDFREMDAETLDFPENSFDAILCRWGLMFLPNLADAMDRIRRLLVPNGKFSAVIWDGPPKVPMIGVPMGVVIKMFDLPPPPSEVPTLFSLSAPGVLEQAFTQAGFADVESERITVMTEFDSPDAYTNMLKDVSAPIIALLADKPSERQAEVWQAISDGVRTWTTADGCVRMPNETICVVGRR